MNKSFLSPKNSNDCDGCFAEDSDLLGFTVKQQSFYNFNVHINTEIRAPAHYSRVFDMLVEANEGDSVNFFLSSPGGRLDGLNVLLEGIRLTDAHVTAIIIGEASSAASILALNCHDVVVTDSGEMLCHEVSYGAGGKGSDVYSHVLHTKRTSEKLLTQTYSGFMSEKELNSLLSGAQIFLTADEIRERLAQRDDYLEAKFLAEQEEAKALQEQDVPKPKRKKKN